MHSDNYARSGSTGGEISAVASNHRQSKSASSSPGFTTQSNVTGYDSADYTDSPPDSVSHVPVGGGGSRYQPQGYPQTMSSTAPYARAPTTGDTYQHPTYAGGGLRDNYTSGGHENAYSTQSGAGYSYNDSDYSAAGARVTSSYAASAPGDEYVSSPNRSYSSGVPATWGPTYGYPRRHPDSPPLSPIETRPGSYFPPSNRDYPVNPVSSGPGPSSPTTPSSVSDSPSTPFSPQQYSSPPYAGPGHGHSHSHSHSSSASASAYIHGTSLPPLQLNTSGGGAAGGHFVPPAGSEYPVPLSAGPYSSTTPGYGRSSPPDHGRAPPAGPPLNQGQVGPFAGAGFAARPFLCDDCGMNFARTHDLKRHQTTHIAGVKKTHPCPYCGKNLSRRDAIKRHVVSKQCPVATEKGYGWPPPEGHVPPLPETVIERIAHRRGENPYPVVNVPATAAHERASSTYSGGYSNASPSSPATYSPSGYPGNNGHNGTGHATGVSPAYTSHGYSAPATAPPAGSVAFEFDHRSSGFKGR